MPHPIDVLGAMITPAVLISAGSMLVMSTSNRLARVIDRIRLLVAECERLAAGQHSAAEDEKLALIRAQVESLLRRILLLRTAITGLYVTITLLVATSIATGLFVLLPRMTAWAPIIIGLAGALAFLYCITLLVREAAIAVRATIEEVDYIHKLLERQGQGEGLGARG
jgi:hypothetical protein